tara:strand:+ start:301 stop:429 length:129 start_codon:yes stop_codon:yes gene_type:complete
VLDDEGAELVEQPTNAVKKSNLKMTCINIILKKNKKNIIILS